MVSKNNRIKRMEEAAERQSHFGIRKLTIGAASVLLGTTLWMGANANSAQAATEDNANDNASVDQQTPHEIQVQSKDVDKVVVNSDNNQAAQDDVIKEDNPSVQTETSEKTSNAPQQNTTKENADTTSQILKHNNQESTRNQAESTNISNVGLKGKQKEDKAVDEPAFDSTNFNITNNSSNYSNDQIANMLFTSLYSVPNNNRSNNSDPVDLDKFNPEYSFQNPYTGNRVLNTTIPQGQYAYSAAIDKGHGNTNLVWTTDKNNPGEKLYFYVNGHLAATISKSQQRSAGFDVGIRNTNDPQFYAGGEYTYDTTKAKRGYNGYDFSLNNVQGINGSKMNNGISGNIRRAGSNIIFQRLDGSGDVYTYDTNGTKWTSVSALAPTEIEQHVYYVNADTGEIMATKSAKGLSGQKYDLTNAAPENVTWKHNQYHLVDSSEASDEALNKVLAKNNGVDIVAKDVADAPLKGQLSSFRPGNMYASVVNFGQGVLFIDKGRRPDVDNNIPVGTTNLNGYEIHTTDQRGEGGRVTATGILKPNGFKGAGGLSSVFFRPGDEVGGAVQGGTAMDKNLFIPGNQDIVFFYKADKPDTPVTPPETQKGSVTVNFHDVTDNVDIPNVGTKTGQQEVGTSVNYNPNIDLTNLENQGYEYVGQNAQVPTTIPNGNQVITINVKHGVIKTQENKEVSRTINYVGKDTTTGATTPVNGSPDNTPVYTQTAHFTREVTTDKVKGAVTQGAWQSDDNIMANVPSAIPSTIGYESVDKPVVGSVKVTDPNNKPADVTVTYTKASKPEVKNVDGKITYIDDTTGHTLQQDNFTPGEVGTAVNYQSQPSINNYINQGYKLVSNNFIDNGTNFKQNNNNYEVHLVHNIKPETEKAQSTAHVHYIISDGKVQAPADSTTQTITLTKTNQVDQVTGKIVTEGNWVPKKPSFDNVASPVVKGYKPDRTNVSFKAPAADKDWVENVVYYPEAKPADEQVNGKQTVHYVDGDNNNAKLLDDSINDTTVFNKHDGKWNETSHKYNDANAPVISGYVAEHKTYTGNIATPQDANKEITIVYHKIGKIIPVDKVTGNPIPGQDQPQYPNDPTDPTKVLDGKKPNVPDYKPETGKPGDPVKPNDPTKDTKVPYIKDAESQNATFEVYDRTDGNKQLNDYAANGMPSTDISFSGSKAYIDTLLKQGYVIDEFVNDKGVSSKPTDSNLSFNTYDNDTKTTQDFKLYLVHGQKDVTQTAQSTGHVHYIISDGKVSAPADSPTQTINWTKTDKVDQVTGKTIKEGTWTPEKPAFDSVNSPKVSGYTPDKKTANFDTPVRGKDQVKTVIYTPEAKPADEQVLGKQIVHYVDGDNNNAKLRDDSINDTTVFNKHDGKWNETSHKYNDANAPVIDGYVAEHKTYNGNIATPEDANKEITIVYHKIGKIIPVDPNHNPIPDAPTPEYKNDPNDPTKVTSNEPTPNVPGWTTDVPSVTPQHPTKDTEVVYTKPEAKKGSVTVVFHDDTDNVQIPNVGTKTGTQKAGTPVNYTPSNDLTNLENQGYVYVGQDGNIPAEIPNGDKTITIHVKHGLEPVNPQNPGKPGQPINPNDPRPKDDQPKYPADSDVVTKDITRTIHYEGADQYTPDDASQTVHFEGKGVLDKVTGKWTTPLTWTNDQSFDAKRTPNIPGYHVVSVDRDTTDNKNVDSATVSHTDSDYKVIVKYAKDEAPKPVEKGSLNVIFHDDTDNVNIPGVGTNVSETEVGTPVDYKSQPDLTKLENKGYVYVGQDGNIPTEITKGNTTITIHVKHGTRPVTPENPADPTKPVDPSKPGTPTPSNQNLAKTDLEKTITRDVTYVYTDGKKSAQPVHQVLNFRGEGTIDTVTGNLVNLNSDGSIKDQRGSIKWNAQSQNFENIPAIDTTGYQIIGYKGNTSATINTTDGSVSSESVTPQSQAIKIEITLSPKATPVETTNGSITYIDDVTGNTLEGTNFTGVVGTQIPYTTANRISNYEKQGYKLVSNDFNDGSQTFDKDAKKNIFTVHLTHDTVPVTPENPGYGYDKTDLDKTITRDVVYQYEDGSQAETPVHQSVNFRGEGTIDKVTHQLVTVDQNGKITGAGKINWTPADGKFDTTKSIDTTQYHITKIAENGTTANVNDKTGVVDGENVTPTSPNSKVVITLAKNPAPVAKDQVAQVIFRDLDENNRTIAETNDMVGKSDTDINFSSADTIKNLEDKGYVLVNNGYDPNGKAPKFDNDDSKKQVFYIDFKHGTRPVTPENPADPTKPVDPSKPNTPTPSNPNLGKKDLDKTITRTIEYKYADGTTAHESVVQNVEFKGEGTIDLVTGNLVNLNPDGSIKDQRGSIKWNADSQNFADVPAIDHKGYYVSNVSGHNTSATVNDTAVSSESVTPNDQNSNIVITLTKKPDVPVAANGSIKYIDDTTNQTIETANFGGAVGQKINYTTAQSIKNWEEKGYKLVSNNFNDGSQVYDKDSAKNTFEVHLVHDTIPVTPENPGYGYDKTDLEKNITRDVVYQYADGSQADTPVHQSVNFRGEGTVDKVTHQLVTVDQNGKITGAGKINWTPADGNFDATKSIDTDKYEIVSVSKTNSNANVSEKTGVVDGETVTPNSQNSTIVITLNKKPEVPVTPETVQGNIDYIDDTTGETLQSANFGGEVGSKINYTTADKIKNYENKGYELVSNNFNDGQQVFAKDGNHFEVHLKHGTKDVTPKDPDPEHGYTKESLTKSGTQTVEYVGAGNNTPQPNVTNVNFEHTLVIDKVTGKIVKDNGWSIVGDNYKSVATPEVKGYTPDKTQAGGVEVSVDPKTGAGKIDTHYVVSYTKNPETPVVNDQKAQVRYLDQDAGNKEITKSDILTGKAESTINYSTADTIQNLENKGYELVYDGFSGKNAKFDNDDNTTQVFDVILKHKHTTITPKNPGKPGEPINPNDPEGPKWGNDTDAKSLTKTGTQTVKYEGAGDKTPQPSVTNIEFNHSITYDNVTGKVVKDNGWTPDSKSYTVINTPNIEGYTADKPYAGGDTVNVTDNNIDREYTVHYTKNPETPEAVQGKVTYIDDTTGKTLDTDNFGGNVGDKIDYTTTDKINNYESQGYELVSNNFKDGNEVFGKSGNNFEVHLKHGTKEVTPKTPDPERGYTKDSLTKTGTQTVIYAGAGDQTPASNTTHVEFEHTLVIDKVTGNIVSDNGWTPSTQTYTKISTPEVKDYTPDKTVVGGETVNVNGDINKTYVVTYTKNTPVTPETTQGKVTYIDDTTGKTLDTDNFNGNVGDKINYTTADKISNYESQGYEIVSNNFVDGNEVFAKDGNNFEVHLKHGTKEVTPKTPDPERGYTKDSLTKTGTQTVKYEGAGNNTPASNTTHVEFEHTLVIDKVNGKVVKDNGWTPSTQTYTKISTPEIEGYTPDKTVVGGETVNVNGEINKTYVVTYTKNKPEEPSKPQPTKPEQPTNAQPSAPNPAPVNPQNPENPTQPTQATDETVTPHGQEVPAEPESNDNEETVAPHASDVPEKMDNKKTVAPKAMAAVKKAASNEDEKTLPQTGEDDTLNEAAAAFGLTAASIGLLGLAGARRRRHN